MGVDVGAFGASRRLISRTGRKAVVVGLLLFGLLSLAPGITAAQSPSPRSCKKVAFTGRVGPARRSLCRAQIHGTPGPQGSAGGRGPRGFDGLPGLTGPKGLQGLLGPAGLTGLTGAHGTAGAQGAAGAQGTPGVEGTAGAEGARGFTGLMGAEGVEGPKGFTGLPGPEGPGGPEGPKGSAGEPGSEGPAGGEGPKGSAGEPGSQGPAGTEGHKGSTGNAGPEGSEGPRGPAGPEGPPGLPAYAEFYALMPPNNATTVGAGIPVEFPQNGPTSGVIARRSSSEFVLPAVGTYRVAFSVSVDEPGQLVIGLDSGSGMVELPYTVYGRATGTSLISGEALVTTTAVNSALELRNPTGNTPALTITPKAGGAHAAVASIVIQQLG